MAMSFSQVKYLNETINGLLGEAFMMLFSGFTRDTLKCFCYKLFHISLFRCLKGSLKASDCKEVKNMQRSRTDAIRTQLQPQKPKREITNMTNSQSTKRKKYKFRKIKPINENGKNNNVDYLHTFYFFLKHEMRSWDKKQSKH